MQGPDSVSLASIVWHRPASPIAFGTGIFSTPEGGRWIQRSLDDVFVSGFLPFKASLVDGFHGSSDASFVRRTSLGGVSFAPETGGLVWHCIQERGRTFVGDFFSISRVLERVDPLEIDASQRAQSMDEIREFINISMASNPRTINSGSAFLYSFENGQVFPRDPKKGFQIALQESVSRIQARADHYLSAREKSGVPKSLIEAMRYATAGGKALRGHLVRECAGIFSEANDAIDSAAAAVEFIHAFSLVHDDLPSMDDDDLRRGQPTVHVKWDEATAILAGDALAIAAFEILSDESLEVEPAARLKAMRRLSVATGSAGMIGGQMLDIETADRPARLSISEIENLQQRKTGALLAASCVIGGILGGANDEDLNRLEKFGGLVGRAFQIADDVLDYDESVGIKLAGPPAGAHMTTFVSLLGLNGAKEEARKLVHEAVQLLDIYGDRASGLRELAQFIIGRSA